MEQAYKGFLIRSGAAAIRDSVGLNLLPRLTGPRNGQERVKLWMKWTFVRSFATYKDAEREADIFAKDWVDCNMREMKNQ